MTEERLKEIKDSIDFQLMIGTIKGHTLDVIKEEEELYNEVVRLRKIIDKANLFIETYLNNVDDIDVNMQVVKDILKQSNLTLEQIIGVENE